jgi:hypothetical protein
MSGTQHPLVATNTPLLRTLRPRPHLRLKLKRQHRCLSATPAARQNPAAVWSTGVTAEACQAKAAEEGEACARTPQGDDR